MQHALPLDALTRRRRRRLERFAAGFDQQPEDALRDFDVLREK